MSDISNDKQMNILSVFENTPELRDLKVSDWPYLELPMRIFRDPQKALAKAEKALLPKVDFKQTFAFDEMLKGVPGLDKAKIYECDIEISPSKGLIGSILADTIDEDVYGEIKASFSFHCVKYEEVSLLLKALQNAPTSLTTSHDFLDTCLISMSELFLNEAGMASGFNESYIQKDTGLISSVFGERDWSQIKPVTVHHSLNALTAGDHETDLYICLRSLLNYVSMYLSSSKQLPYIPRDNLSIFFDDDEIAHVRIVEKGASERVARIGKLTNKKASDSLSKLTRLRSEINERMDRLRKLTDKQREFSFQIFDELPRILANEKGSDERKRVAAMLEKSANELKAEASKQFYLIYETQREIVEAYHSLHSYVSTHKEKVLESQAKLQNAKQAYEQSVQIYEPIREIMLPMASNLEGLPAHFAAVPAGIDCGTELSKDGFGRAILKVRDRPDLNGRTDVYSTVTLPLDLGHAYEKDDLLNHAELVFGHGGVRWLLPQGLAATGLLYREKGGLSAPDKRVRIYLREWVYKMRPHMIARFKKKGIIAAFGNENKPIDMFRAFLGTMSLISYTTTAKSKKLGSKGGGTTQQSQDYRTVNGFYHIHAEGVENGQYYVEVSLNSALFDLISGHSGVQPMYMVSNTEAMLNYDRTQLAFLPSSQWAIELLYRQNLFQKKDETVVHTQKGDGITRLELASKMGVLKGPKESPAVLIKRVTNVFETLADKGVIADMPKVDGREKTGAAWTGVKVFVEAHPNYRVAYDHMRKQRAFEAAEKSALNPFITPRARRSANKRA